MCDCHESKRVFFDSTGSMRFSSQLRMQYDLPEICLAPRKGNVEKWLMEVQGSADMVDMFEMKTTDATFHADMKWLLNPNVFSMRPSCSLSFSNLTELPTGSMIDSLTKVTAASLLAYAKNERRGLKISLIVMLALGHFNGTTTVLHLVLPISALLSDTVGIHWSHSLKSKRIHISIYIYILFLLRLLQQIQALASENVRKRKMPIPPPDIFTQAVAMKSSLIIFAMMATSCWWWKHWKQMTWWMCAW